MLENFEKFVCLVLGMMYWWVH